MNRPASLVTGIFLILIALVQLCRVIFQVNVVAAGVGIPIWLSAVGIMAFDRKKKVIPFLNQSAIFVSNAARQGTPANETVSQLSINSIFCSLTIESLEKIKRARESFWDWHIDMIEYFQRRIHYGISMRRSLSDGLNAPEHRRVCG
jgi:hypothetical protein